jgi:CRISPR/Cas system-associated endonuclease Cas3-HD
MLFANTINLDKGIVIKRLFLTVAFHDIGKANC